MGALTREGFVYMSVNWLDTSDDTVAMERAHQFWAELKSDVDTNMFWYDRIKKLRNQPSDRLNEALANLPLPAAFRDAATALRVMVREKRKLGKTYEEDISFLYWLAAVESFMLAYAERLKEPGFNVMESAPGKLVGSLPFTYSELGYHKLSLLNKTDCKWIVEAWGEPDSHKTLNEMYQQIWNKYENKLIKDREKSNKNVRQAIKDISRHRQQ